MTKSAAVPARTIAAATIERRLPIGAEPTPEGVHVRVWAPGRRRVELVLGEDGDEAVPLAAEAGGYFAGLVRDAGAGALYRFRLDGKGPLLPDPASRFQPDGPHGPSMVIDPAAFAWSDGGWRGVGRDDQLVYELHVGTFTAEGTWAAAMRELPRLAELGVTILEVMPVADFPGRFGWGYDGVDLFAPTRLYGTPDDFRRFVDRAHALGLGVVLDVVYNHLGPDGNYLKCFAEDYFTDRYENEWGEAINFDGANSGPVREFFIANAGYWIDEFHLDGLRLDATQQIFDASPVHVLREIGARVRVAARGRGTWIVNENEPQNVRLVHPAAAGGLGLDALWNDDFHHSAMVALTGRSEAYYSDYRGTPQELVAAARHGFLYQGQRYRWQGKRRGTPTRGLPPSSLVSFLQNHDQVANSGRGLRIAALAAPGSLRAMTALWLLMPQTPMLFQGQEFAASAPFLFFADHEGELAAKAAAGRAEFLGQFPSLAGPAMQAELADPGSEATFRRCKLDSDERARPGHAETLALHRDLIRLRREDAAFRAAQTDAARLDGAVLGPESLVLRYFGENGDDRLLLVNLGRDLHLYPAPEPLLAPPEGRAWRLLWSSEDPRYGGGGTRIPEDEAGWHLPGRTALVMAPRPLEEEHDG